MELSATKTGTFWISKQIFASFQKVVTESLGGILIVCVLGVLIIFYSKTFWINYRTHGTLKRQFKNRLNGTETYFQNTSSCSPEDITNIYKKVRLCVCLCRKCCCCRAAWRWCWPAWLTAPSPQGSSYSWLSSAEDYWYCSTVSNSFPKITLISDSWQVGIQNIMKIF